jgi:predicted  nucleic acid-binding Zn-ribbon protein
MTDKKCGHIFFYAIAEDAVTKGCSKCGISIGAFVANLESERDKLAEENKRYKTALEKIASAKTINSDIDCCEICIAREALFELSGNSGRKEEK